MNTETVKLRSCNCHVKDGILLPLASSSLRCIYKSSLQRSILNMYLFNCHIKLKKFTLVKIEKFLPYIACISFFKFFSHYVLFRPRGI